MSHGQSAIEASYGLCRKKARQSGSSFYAAFSLLPRRKRRAMDALYAFTRHTDDLVDNAEPLEVRREAVARWRASLQAALAKHPDAGLHRPPERGVFATGSTAMVRSGSKVPSLR